MSCDNLEQLNTHVEAKDETQKSCKISYTRDFLLSLSQLDVCQKLPNGFDQSILSEFEDVPQDRYRIAGGLSSHSYRRNDYSSSPPTRGDGNNYSRGNHGRWDSRSSGRSDRDSDSQSDLDSDSGKRGNQFRRSWQIPEHDGLLGSGSFPRPPGFTGTSGPKSRTSDPYQLNRSNEPYHPPRPYKAVPHLRRDTHDSFNDETFGSFENTSEDRAEEERKRRASFELMRKEQHKAFQEKQKNPEKSKVSFDFSELLEDPKDNKRFLNRRNESDEPVIQPAPNNDSDKSSFPSAANVSRPLVPPGFSSPVAEKNIGNKPFIHPQLLEIGNELDGGLLHAKGSRLFGGDANKQEGKQSFEEIDSRGQLLGGLSILNSVNKKGEKIQNFPLAVDISKKAVDEDDHSKALEPLEATRSNQFMEPNANDVLSSGIGGESTPTHPTSILDKLFGSALTLNGVDPSSIIEKNNIQADDAWTPHMVQSSKFAQWFHEEETRHLSSGRPDKLVEDFSSDRPNEPVDVPSFSKTTKSVDDPSSERSTDLLSLTVGGEKSGSSSFSGEKSLPFIVGGESNRLLVEDTKKIGSEVFNAPASFPLQLAEIADGHVAPKSTDKIVPVPAVLTCEDLEQSILSKITENPSVLPPPVERWNGLVAEAEQKKVDTDSNASQHLLSLLKKAEPSGNSGILPSARSHDMENENLGSMFFGSGETENNPSAGKPLTLETLFGSAFMKELKSAGAPTSSQERPGDSFPMDNLFSLPADNGNGILASNQRAQVTPESIGEQILGFNIQHKVDPSEVQTEFGSKLGGFPEEDTLVAANDPLNLHNFITGGKLAKAEPQLRPEKAVDMHSDYQDERTIMGLQGPYDMRESDVQYRKLHGQASSLHLHPSQLNHMVQRSHSLDSNPANNNAQMKFIDPNHQIPANLHRPPLHHPAMAGLDPNHPMMQQMHMPGNFPPHLARGFPRGAPLSPHLNNQVAGFMQEPNPMQGFPFGPKQPNFGGPGIPPQGGDAGSGALHNIQSMEQQRSNAKQMHPFPNHGIYGPELDLGFGFR